MLLMKDLATTARQRYKERQVIKKSGIQRFHSSFNSRCLEGNCLGWKMRGSYFTETVANGSHSLHVKVTVRAPVRLHRAAVKATLFVGSDLTELLTCNWTTGNVIGQCDSSLTEKTLDDCALQRVEEGRGGPWNYEIATITDYEANVYGWR